MMTVTIEIDDKILAVSEKILTLLDWSKIERCLSMMERVSRMYIDENVRNLKGFQ